MRKILLGAVVLLLFPTTGVADQRSMTDPEDGGSQRVWDIAKITHSHVKRDQTPLLRHKVTFYDDVRNTNLDQGFGGSGITYHFEFNPTKPGPERTAYFGRNDDDSLYVAVADRRGRVRGFANWFQPSPEELAIEFPESLLRPGLERYRWKVTAVSRPPCENDGAPADGCPDETRWLSHRLK